MFPISFAQQRLWFLDQLNPGTPAHNVSRAIEIHGPLDTRRLHQTLSIIVDRQESLRTAFASVDGVPHQFVRDVDLELPVIDLSGHSPSQRQADALRIAGEEARTGFDLGCAPLCRATLIRLSTNEHILMLVVHHIIADGWSMGVLFKDIGQIYRGLADGRSVDLPELPLQYADFAQWQREHFSRGAVDQQLDYWKTRLRGCRGILDLPTDHPRPAMQSHKGATEASRVDEELTERLKRLSQTEGATLYMALLSAFQALLWHYTHADDMLIGTPTAGRNDVKLENLVGNFVHTLVIRGDLSGDPTFIELLRCVRNTALEAYANQDAPFEKLVEALQPERSTSHTPLFQVMFVFQNLPKQELVLPNLTLRELEFDAGLAKVDLTLEIAELDGLYCWFEYSTDLFERATIQRMTRHFETLLRSIVRDPGRQLSKLDILGDKERDQLLLEWNSTTVNYRREALIDQVFEEQAVQTPNAVAVKEGSNKITYRELNRRANQLANLLVKKGVNQAAPVGIYLERSVASVVALLGTLKAGAPYVPLDPAYPKYRLEWLIKDSHCRIVLTHDGLKHELSGDVEAISLDGARSLIEEQPTSTPVVGPRSSEELAYIIYTSGSTGKPKGVQGTHRGAINRFEWMWRTYPFEPDETCCLKTAPSFVDSVWETFGPLLQGVRSVVVPDEVVTDPECLLQLFAEEQVTRIVLVPSLLLMLLDHAENLGSRVPRLRLWSASGETLPLALARRFREAHPTARLLNIYGSSEMAADITCYEVKDMTGRHSVPIGRPISNAQIYILDRHLNPVPVGIHGHIYGGGDCLARGYWRRDDLTSERFIPNPFSPDKSQRLYATGDLGRYLPDGNIEYLGRADRQVKLRGMRIELGDIEANLIAHPAVRDALVVVQGAEAQMQRLVAYVVGDGRADLATELRRFLKSRVPPHMVPAHFIESTSVPLLPNGKVDRQAVMSSSLQLPSAQRRLAGARNETEKKLTGIWQEVLPADRIGIHDNFFELGGHSLLAMRVLARIRNVFQVDVSVRSLFEEPTIEALAREVEEAQASGIRVPPPAIPRRPQRSASRDALLAELDRLSPDQVDGLLQTLLSKK